MADFIIIPRMTGTIIENVIHMRENLSSFGVLKTNFLYLNESTVQHVRFKFDDLNCTPIEISNVRDHKKLSKLFFSDQLSETDNIVYEIGLTPQKNMVRKSDGSVSAKMFYFFDVLKSVEKSDYKTELYENEYIYDLLDNFVNRHLHMILNFEKSKPNHPQLLTYEMSGYCAYVPIPEKTTRLFLIDAFEWRIWATLFGSIVAGALVWRFYKVWDNFES